MLRVVRRLPKDGLRFAARTLLVAVGFFTVAVPAMRSGLADAANLASLAVSVNGMSVATIDGTAVENNYDLGQVKLNGGFHTGMSVTRLAELVGVAPANVFSVTVTNPAPFATTGALAGASAVSGFPADPQYPTDTLPRLALFDVTDTGGGTGYMGFLWLSSPNPGVGIQGITNSALNVAFSVKHLLLSVGPPQAAPTTLTAGGVVQFGPPTVTLNGAPVSGLSYSWDFGDGSAPGTGPSPTHAYTTSGTWDVFVTVTDTNGDGGVSRPGVVVTVGKPPGSPAGPPGPPGNSGNADAPPTGGGTGPPTGASNGAYTGKGNSANSARRRRARPRGRRGTSVGPTAAGGAKASGNGSGGSGSAAGSGSGSGSGAGDAGSAGAAGATAGATKAQATRAGPGGGRGALPRSSAAHTAVPPGLVGVLVDSGSANLSYSSPVASWLAATHAAARASAGHDTPANWQWLLGVIAVVIWVLTGAMRELSPRARSRRRRRGGTGVKAAA